MIKSSTHVIIRNVMICSSEFCFICDSIHDGLVATGKALKFEISESSYSRH